MLTESRPTKAITGTIAVALLLAGTRWGSYLGYSPLFLTDILIALAVVDSLLGRSRFGAAPLNGKHLPSPHPLFVAFFLYIVIRGITSFEYAFTMDWLRDLVPFLYGVLAFISAASIARSTEADRAKTMRFIWAALIAHLAWTSAVVLTPLGSMQLPLMPNSPVPVLSLRPDTDMAVLGITAALILRRVILGKSKFWGVLAMGLCLVTAVGMNSRAGLISVAVSLAIAYGMTYSSTQKNHSRRTRMALAVPVILAIATAGFAQTSPGERLIASTLGTSSGAVHELNAIGTERARELSWTGIIDWTFEDTSRTVVGSGFGNDFLSESGVLQFLAGTDYTNVRSPHNWIIGVLARLGIIGVGLAIVTLLAATRIVLRNRSRIGGSELLLTAAMIVAGFLPIALLGVVLESPFGAVPFWWALGLLFSLRSANHPTTTRNIRTTRTFQQQRQEKLKAAAKKRGRSRSLPATR